MRSVCCAALCCGLCQADLCCLQPSYNAQCGLSMLPMCFGSTHQTHLLCLVGGLLCSQSCHPAASCDIEASLAAPDCYCLGGLQPRCQCQVCLSYPSSMLQATHHCTCDLDHVAACCAQEDAAACPPWHCPGLFWPACFALPCFPPSYASRYSDLSCRPSCYSA